MNQIDALFAIRITTATIWAQSCAAQHLQFTATQQQSPQLI